jgi:hypothetical protein
MVAALPTDPDFALRHLLSRVEVEDRGHSSPCWIWHGPRNHHGYGRTCVPGIGRSVRIHRAMYQLCVGPIHHGLEIDHLCRVRECCNPAHLETVTRLENMQRAAKLLVPATHCHRGHEFTPENVIRNSSGSRVCRACLNEWHRKRRASRKLQDQSTISHVRKVDQ